MANPLRHLSLPRWLKAFWRHDRGNFAMITGLLAIPLFGMVGLGLDVTRAYIADARLQGAVDNATLAAASMRGHPKSEIRAVAKKYFDSNYRSGFWAPPTEPVIDIDEDGNVAISAQAASPNYFLRVFSIDEFELAANAAATAQARGLEVVLVLDVTGSMSGTKIQQMRTAAKDLVDILFGDETVHDKLRIGLVPFAASVQIDPSLARSSGWIDEKGESLWARSNFIEMDDKHRGTENFCKQIGSGSAKRWVKNTSWSYKSNGVYDDNDRADGPANAPALDDSNYANGPNDDPDCNDPDTEDDNFAYELFYGSDWVDTGGIPYHVADIQEPFSSVPAWNGCVEARPGTLKEDDTPPDPSNPNTLWVPFFYPDGPDSGGFVNDYIDDGFNDNAGNKSEAARRQGSIDKYKNQPISSATGQSAKGPFRMCVRSRVMPLNNNKSQVKTAIDGLIADGYTHVALGAVWGWRVISPTEPYSEGKPYDDMEWDKAIVILTDGDNTMPGDSVNSSVNINGGSEYTAYGFASQERLGAGKNTTGKMVTEQNASLGRVCGNIKAIKKPNGKNAISVYTITFGNEVDTGNIKSTMIGCATDASNYFDARNGLELQEAFEKIATELSKIRLTQ